jgi:hypothetical protein
VLSEFLQTTNVHVTLIDLGDTSVFLTEAIEIYRDHVEDIDILEGLTCL